MEGLKAEIIVPKSSANIPFTYIIPDRFKKFLQIGSAVVIPFKNRLTYGFIFNATSEFSSNNIKLKEIIDISQCNFFNEVHLSLYNWLSMYYHESISRVLETTLPSIDVKKFHLLDRYIKINKINAKSDSKINPKINLNDASRENQENVYNTNFAGLTQDQRQSQNNNPGYDLTEDQSGAVSRIKKFIQENFYKTFLLHGVTASGKTEIYLNLLEFTLNLNKQVIIIVPEIFITNQFIYVMTKRFSKMIKPHEFAVFHSRISKREKLINWFKILHGDIKIVLGTRSAIFAPLTNAGLIVVDEEHDSSYKQGSGLLYNARDVAVMIAKKTSSVAVLGSATPSLESYYNAKELKKYEYIFIKMRVGEKPMPEIKLIDLKNEFKKDNDSPKNRFSNEMLSEVSRQAITKNLEQKSQTLIFLNRRGFSTFIICKSCGHQFLCKNCAISLVYHKGKDSEGGMLKCHYCSHTEKVPKVCPECLSDNIEPYGIGIQKLENKIKEIFGEAAIVARIDSDIAGQKKAGLNIFNKMKRGEIDILIGTQIVAKGHDFPNIALVIVVFADSLLNIPDFRSGERTFQILTQVSGRAGRGDTPGKVIFQTFNSNNYVLAYSGSHNIESFYEKELNLRKEYGYPPYSKIIAIKLFDKNLERLEKNAYLLRTVIDSIVVPNSGFSKISILGPSPCPIPKLKNNFRYQIILKFPDGAKNGLTKLHKALEIIKGHPSVNRYFLNKKFLIDVDPNILI